MRPIIAFKSISEITNEFCGVLPTFVKSIGTLCSAMGSGFAIVAAKFGRLCKETEDIYFAELG